MKPETIQLIEGLGGKYHYFSQRQYITMNQWNHHDTAQRQGALASNSYNHTKNVTVYGLGSGVCIGLASAYLIAGDNPATFKANIFGSEGKALIRGMMNLQAILSKQGRTDNFHKVVNEFLKIYHVKLIKGNMVSQHGFANNIGGAISKNILPSFKYLITIVGSVQGHALALRLESGVIKLFDPNYGEVIYPHGTLGSQAMASFLTHLFYEYYPWFKSVHIQRYALR